MDDTRSSEDSNTRRWTACEKAAAPGCMTGPECAGHGEKVIKVLSRSRETVAGRDVGLVENDYIEALGKLMMQHLGLVP